jgi:hypothetical protein
MLVLSVSMHEDILDGQSKSKTNVDSGNFNVEAELHPEGGKKGKKTVTRNRSRQRSPAKTSLKTGTSVGATHKVGEKT